MLIKQKRHKSKKILNSARGEECTIRLDNICNFNPETTVFCHSGKSGTATKPSDIIGFYGCSDCHNEVDRKTRKIADLNFLAAEEFRAVRETQQLLLDKGLIKI